MSEQSEALWTTDDVAERLKIPAGTLRRWRREGQGPPFVRLGRHVRYDPAAVRRWLAEQGRERRA
jgi:excisionase family DNA binding protein